MMDTRAFLQQVLIIEAEKPTYRLGGSGKDGTCDCIGLVMGALRRAGGTWTGIHGSNWAARHEVDDLRWTSTSELHPGEVVFKAHKPGEAGYNLPSRYAGDVDDNDYYHVGVVYSANPLVIIHCTGPGVIRDTRLGAWKYVARLKQVTLDGNAADQQEDKLVEQPDENSGAGTILWRGRVKTSKGRGISLWDSSAKKWARKRVPDGAVVAVMGEADSKGFVLAQYDGVQGMADTRYLVRTDAGQEGASSKALRYTVTIRHLEESAANALMKGYPGAEIEAEVISNDN